MVDIKIIKMSDIARCPKRSLLVQHYQEDGTCLCPTEVGDIREDGKGNKWVVVQVKGGRLTWSRMEQVQHPPVVPDESKDPRNW